MSETSIVGPDCFMMVKIIEESVSGLQQNCPVNKLDDHDRSFAVFIHVAYSRVVQILMPEASTRWLLNSGISPVAERTIGVLLVGRDAEVADTAEQVRARIVSGVPLDPEWVVETVGQLFEELSNYEVDPMEVLHAVACS
jgi:hypothetical protein